MTSVTDRTASSAAGSASAADVVARLRATFATGKTKDYSWRIQQLKGMVRFLEEHEKEMAEALASDLGRNEFDTWFGDIASTQGEAEYAIKHLRKWMKSKRVGVPLALMPGKASYRYEPLGVVMVIGPWNYPFYLCLGPMVGALAAGNCIVLKPSEHAPAASAVMAKYLPQYLDKDALAVVEGEASVTQELIDARVDHIFFTGGTEIGRKIMQAAAPHLTPVTLELGGKSPVIVTKDANLKVAANRIVWGKIINSGQTCLAPDYILVDNSVKTELVAKMKESLATMRAGDEGTQKIVNDRQFGRLKGMLDTAGGSVVQGGEAADGRIAPTLIVDADPDGGAMGGEIFGPLLPIIGVGGLSEAIAFVNKGEKPLATYVFSNSRSEIERVVKDVPCGAVTSNHTLMHVLAPQLPFGGVGDSGMGAYHGKWGYECFSHRKSTLRMPTKPDLKLSYPPYSDKEKKILRKLA